MSEWSTNLMLFGTGCVAGILNVVAGGGSFLSLPVLIFLGLPTTLANGTNRVAILIQNIGAVWSFHRHGVMDWKSLFWAALPTTVGAALGALLALQVGDEAFKKILAFLMVAVTLWTLWDPLKKKLNHSRTAGGAHLLSLTSGFFVVGIYSGFVQAGVGFLILATTTLAGFNLVKGNAIKVLVLLASMIVSLTVFASQGMVNWTMGFVLGVGSLLGGLLGVKLTVLKGHVWIKHFVTATVIIFALQLWFFD